MTRLVVVAAASIGLILFVAFVVSRLLRTRTKGLSIRMQVFLALAVIVGSFAFGLGVMVIDRVEARAVRVATQAAEDEAQAIAGIIEGEMARTGLTLPDFATRLESERNKGADLRLQLLDNRGRQLFPGGSATARDPAGTVSVTAPIHADDVRVGAVRVIKPTIVMRRLLADFAPTVLVISLVLGAAAALAAAWIGKAIAAPIEALTNFAERVSAGEPARPPSAVQGREVARLSRSLDSMRRQLEGRPFVETFAADLSHELKNPVAAIRASAEVLEDSALDEPEEARRFVARIHEAAERIDRLLKELLSLARIEARGAESFDPVDLAELARRVVGGVHDARRVDLETRGDCRVRGDDSWLLRAVSNLIHNAQLHAVDGDPIRVLVAGQGQQVLLEVDNPGMLPKHVRSQLFRRFVSTRQDKGGSGLGLAIVRAVAEAHGGSVELAEPGPPRVVFQLKLPAAHRSRL